LSMVSGAQADQEDAPGALHRGEEQVVLQQASLLSVAWTRSFYIYIYKTSLGETWFAFSLGPHLPLGVGFFIPLLPLGCRVLHHTLHAESVCAGAWQMPGSFPPQQHAKSDS